MLLAATDRDAPKRERVGDRAVLMPNAEVLEHGNELGQKHLIAVRPHLREEPSFGQQIGIGRRMGRTRVGKHLDEGVAEERPRRTIAATSVSARGPTAHPSRIMRNAGCTWMSFGRSAFLLTRRPSGKLISPRSASERMTATTSGDALSHSSMSCRGQRGRTGDQTHCNMTERNGSEQRRVDEG